MSRGNHRAHIGRSFLERWDGYWFCPEPVIGLALFRICFGVSALLYHVPRLPYVPAFYTNSGFLWPLQPAPWLKVVVPLSPFIAYALSIFLIICLAAVTIGYRTRSAALIAFVIHSYLSLLESFATNSIRRVIAIYLFLLVFSRAGAYFSWEARRRTGSWASDAVPKSPAAVRRVMVWHLALLYILNAATKTTYGFREWIRGETVLWSLQGITWSQPWASRLALRAEMPVRVLSALGYVGYLLLGPALLWRKTVTFAIAFGLSWHFVTLVTTTIMPAWLAWVSVFILVPDPGWWEQQWKMLVQWRLPLRRAVIAVLLVAALVGGALLGRI